jgi:hypothetical protein
VPHVQPVELAPPGTLHGLLSLVPPRHQHGATAGALCAAGRSARLRYPRRKRRALLVLACEHPQDYQAAPRCAEAQRFTRDVVPFGRSPVA